jgi:glutaredoxin
MTDEKSRKSAGETLDLELYKLDGCPFCARVLDVISRLKVAVRVRDIEKDPEAARRLVEAGGLDQVPCLFVDGQPMYESADIIAFLEKNFG